jgi:hypothetical protein
MGRPKGSRNRLSQKLIRKLEDDHDFHVVNELIELYGYDKQIFLSLAKRIAENLENDLPPNFGFTEEEADYEAIGIAISKTQSN